MSPRARRHRRGGGGRGLPFSVARNNKQHMPRHVGSVRPGTERGTKTVANRCGLRPEGLGWGSKRAALPGHLDFSPHPLINIPRVLIPLSSTDFPPTAAPDQPSLPHPHQYHSAYPPREEEASPTQRQKGGKKKTHRLPTGYPPPHRLTVSPSHRAGHQLQTKQVSRRRPNPARHPQPFP